MILKMLFQRSGSHEDLVTMVTWMYLLSSFAEILNGLLIRRRRQVSESTTAARQALVMFDQDMLLELRLLREGCLALAAS